ncbi:MAG: hypothetical protein WCA46_04880 [Actinocatenispora sp.]
MTHRTYGGRGRGLLGGIFGAATLVAVILGPAQAATAHPVTAEANTASAAPSNTVCYNQGALDFWGTNINIRYDPTSHSESVYKTSFGQDCWHGTGQVTGESVTHGSYTTDQWEQGYDNYSHYGYVSWAYLSVNG